VLFFMTMFSVLLAIIVGVEFFLDMLVKGTDFVGFLQKMAPLTAIWIGPLMIWMVAKAARYNRIRSVMLRHRRCPHCGYDLRMLPTDPEDEATVCPECGCAWRLHNTQQSESHGNVVSDLPDKTGPANEEDNGNG
jgi:hypothetical protein